MTQQPTILVIQPDRALQALIVRVLKTASFQVLRSDSIQEAQLLVEQEALDLVVIDQWIPDQDALEFCRNLREHSNVPLLMVGASSDAYMRGIALDQGIDDYVITPFHESEFLARVRALLRRSQQATQQQQPQYTECGALLINWQDQQVRKYGELVHLTKTEWALLKLFVHYHGQVLTHRMLLQQVWGKSYSEDRAYLHAYIRRLRAKLEDDPTKPQLIHSESGIGYRFMRIEAASQAPQANPTNLSHLRLPYPIAALIGRQHELTDLQALLSKPEARLITITGMGGSGKTSMASYIAQQLHQSQQIPVVFVALDTINDPNMVAASLARAAGLRDHGDDQSLERLQDWISNQTMLFILDNFEQVLGAAPQVSQLLQHCPNLKIVVTSRIVLGVYAEYEFVLPPLGLPDLQQSPPLEQIAASPAVQLFVQRAQAVDNQFRLTAENAPIVAEICVRLDGLALAIELAAVHSKFYPPKVMLQRLNQRLDFLYHNSPDRTQRQHSLRGAIDWSYELLGSYEQTIFQGISLFDGSFTREAAQALWPNDEPSRIERVLQHLVNASLLQRETSSDGLSWFAMLDTIREYSLSKLPKGEAHWLQQQLLDYYVELMQQAEQAFLVSNHTGWIKRLERELPTIRSILAWGIQQEYSLAVWQLCASFWRFWHEQGHISEGREWLAKIQHLQSNAIPLAIRDKVRLGAGVLAFIQDDYAAANQAFGEVLIEPRSEHQPKAIAHALTNIGMVAYWQGRYGEAIQALEESLPLLKMLDDRYGMASSLRHLGMSQLVQHGSRSALALLAESLSFYQELGSKSGIGTAMGFYGRALLIYGDDHEAQQWLEQSIAMLEPLGNWPAMARSQTFLGRVALAQRRYADAQQLLNQSLATLYRVGDREGVAASIEGLAVWSALNQQPERAQALWSGADWLRELIGAPIPPADYQALRRMLPQSFSFIQQAQTPKSLRHLVGCALASDCNSLGCDQHEQ